MTDQDRDGETPEHRQWAAFRRHREAQRWGWTSPDELFFDGRLPNDHPAVRASELAEQRWEWEQQR